MRPGDIPGSGDQECCDANHPQREYTRREGDRGELEEGRLDTQPARRQESHLTFRPRGRVREVVAAGRELVVTGASITVGAFVGSALAALGVSFMW